ncbi:MAG: hypothetical protein ACYCXF_09510 [Thermoleophilia bacterium]
MKKLMVLLFSLMLVVGIVAVTGCGSSAPPSDTVDKALTQAQSFTSEHVDYEVNLGIKGDLSSLGAQFSSLGDLNFAVKGGADIDNRNADSPKAQGTLAVTGLDEIMKGLAGAGGASATATQTQKSLSLIAGYLSDMQFVVVDKTAYAKMAGSWYNMGNTSSLSSLGSTTGVDLSSTASNSKCYKDAMKDTSKFGSDKIMKNLSEVGSENVDGTDTTHFKADIDLSKTLTALADIARGCGNSQGAGGLEGGQQQLTSMFRTFTMEMWVDKDNNMRQVKINMDIDGKAIGNAASSMTGSTTTTGGLDSITIDITARFSRFGEDFSIAKPEGTILKLQDLLGSSGLGSSLGGLSGLSGPSGTSTTGTRTSGI